MTKAQLIAGREIIATLAERENEIVFAYEVRAGMWDHRNDVQVASANPAAFIHRPLKEELN